MTGAGGWPGPGPAVADDDALPVPPPARPVKVLHVITRFIAGSGGNTLLSVLGTDRGTFEPWVAGADGGPLWEQAERAGVRTVRLAHMRERIEPREDLRCLVELVRLMRKERFDVVHTHCSKAGLVARVAARLAGVPVVVHTFHLHAVQDHLPRTRRLAYLLMERSVRSLAHHYVAVAPQLAREAVRLRIARPGTVSVVPSAVELSPAQDVDGEAVRRELRVPAGAPLVGTVGRIVAQKAPLDFVRMAAVVRRSHPTAVFVMVGDTTLESAGLEAETRAEADRLGVPVVFTGFRDDAARLAAAFDAYVVPSRYEGLGRALTEAMASGRPVVATAVNGVPDLVSHGRTGLLAPSGDVDALARCVAWVLDHPQEAQLLGAQGRQRVLAAFAPSAMAEQLDELYRELMGIPGESVPVPDRAAALPLPRRSAVA